MRVAADGRSVEQRTVHRRGTVPAGVTLPFGSAPAQSARALGTVAEVILSPTLMLCAASMPEVT